MYRYLHTDQARPEQLAGHERFCSSERRQSSRQRDPLVKELRVEEAQEQVSFAGRCQSLSGFLLHKATAFCWCRHDSAISFSFCAEGNSCLNISRLGPIPLWSTPSQNGSRRRDNCCTDRNATPSSQRETVVCQSSAAGRARSKRGSKSDRAVVQSISGSEWNQWNLTMNVPCSSRQAISLGFPIGSAVQY